MGRPRKKVKEPESLILQDIPSLNLESKNVDPFLAKIISITYLSLVDIKKVKHKFLTFEENRCNSTFLYYIENKAKHLSGYIGRDKVTDEILFLLVDQRRFHWAKEEGFIQDKLNAADRQLVFEQIGVLIKADGLKSFINYIAGDKDYQFDGDYILAAIRK